MPRRRYPPRRSESDHARGCVPSTLTRVENSSPNPEGGGRKSPSFNASPRDRGPRGRMEDHAEPIEGPGEGGASMSIASWFGEGESSGELRHDQSRDMHFGFRATTDGGTFREVLSSKCPTRAGRHVGFVRGRVGGHFVTWLGQGLGERGVPPCVATGFRTHWSPAASHDGGSHKQAPSEPRRRSRDCASEGTKVQMRDEWRHAGQLHRPRRS